MKVAVAKKIGMSQVYTDDGIAAPVTVLALEDARVTRAINGGSHVEIGMGVKKNSSKAEKGIYGESTPKFLKVVKLETPDQQPDVKAETFTVGEYVHVSGVTKGKGFQGVVKRHGFKGGPNTHGGQSGKARSPGSIGPGTSHGRVFKGKQMAGHMGMDNKTVQNLKVVLVDAAKNLIAVRGAVPGNTGAYVFIRKAKYK